MREFVAPVVDLAGRMREVSSELMELSAADPHAAGAAAVPYLRLAGHLALSHTWLRAVRAALSKAGSGDPFYASKIATARFYFRRLLPQSIALWALQYSSPRAGESLYLFPCDERGNVPLVALGRRAMLDYLSRGAWWAERSHARV